MNCVDFARKRAAPVAYGESLAPRVSWRVNSGAAAALPPSVLWETGNGGVFLGINHNADMLIPTGLAGINGGGAAVGDGIPGGRDAMVRGARVRNALARKARSVGGVIMGVGAASGLHAGAQGYGRAGGRWGSICAASDTLARNRDLEPTNPAPAGPAPWISPETAWRRPATARPAAVMP